MLSLPQVQALTALAKQRGIRFSEMLRRVIDAFLEQHKN